MGLEDKGKDKSQKNSDQFTVVDWDTLPETNSSHLKMDGWNTIASFWDGLFSGAFAVSFRGCIQGIVFSSHRNVAGELRGGS